MSAPSWEEMEAKRQEMIASFKDIASAMTRCVAVIEDYARLSPATLGNATAASAQLSALVDPIITNGGFTKAGKPTKASLQAAIAAAATADGELPELVGPDGKKIKPKKKKEKKIKDPNAPKRPPSAYLLFQNDVREEIRKSNEGLPYKEVLAMISEKWKSLPADQKKVYEDAYNDANGAFLVQGEAYAKDLAAAAEMPAPVAAPVAKQPLAPVESSDSSDSDTDSDSSDDTPPVTTIPVPAVKTPKPVAAPPSTLNQVPPSTDLKKEKKRKAKEEEATAAHAVVDKKKKKGKE